MKNIQTFAICLISLGIWNCNDVSKPVAASNSESKIPAAVDGLAKVAAGIVGLTPIESTPYESEMPFKTRDLEAFKEAGLCSGFTDLLQELQETPLTNGKSAISPKLHEVAICFGNKLSEITDANTLNETLPAVVDECFCHGTGTVFANYSFALSKYQIPKTGIQFKTPSTGKSFSASASSPGEAFNSSGNTAEHGYKSPSL